MLFAVGKGKNYIKDAYFYNNTAKIGAAISSTSSLELVLENAIF